MGGAYSSPTDPNNPTLRFGSGSKSPMTFESQKPWEIMSSKPEAVAQGVEKGMGSLAQGVAMAAMLNKKGDGKKPDTSTDVAQSEIGKLPMDDASSVADKFGQSKNNFSYEEILKFLRLK